MIIAGLQKTSFIDYPGKISAILFVRGCNFRCPYCHNPELVDPPRYYPEIFQLEIFDFLKRRQNILEGIVITGGEPCIHADLPEFIRKIKKLNYLVKLDTNGTNFLMLQQLVRENLIDYIAMDIKHHLERYQEITGIESRDIKKSIDFIMRSGLDYEFRTTVLPKYFQVEDFVKLGQLIRGAKLYYLQQFRPHRTLDYALSNEQSFTDLELEQFKKIMENYVARCEIRGII